MGKVVKKKIVVLGISKSGKTALIHKYATNKFLEKYKETVLGDSISITRQYDHKKDVQLNIWDIQGKLTQDIQGIMSINKYGAAALKKTNEVIVVIDATKTIKENKLNSFIKEIARHTKGNVHVHFVINKTDLSNEVKVRKEAVKKYLSAHPLINENACHVSSISAKEDRAEEIHKKIFENVVNASAEDKPKKISSLKKDNTTTLFSSTSPEQTQVSNNGHIDFSKVMSFLKGLLEAIAYGFKCLAEGLAITFATIAFLPSASGVVGLNTVKLGAYF